MCSPIVLQGNLVIARDCSDSYTATLGGCSVDEQIASYLDGGKYAYIRMIGEGPTITIRGGLEIFTLKVERSYFRNGWRAAQESESNHLVRCNSRSLASRIADFFRIEKNTRFDCGWYQVLIESRH